MKECKHQHRFVGNRTGYTASGHTLTIRLCELCSAWLSLGPSNDEGEQVRVEMSAATMAARRARKGQHILNGEPYAVWCGWWGVEDSGFGAPLNADYHAGWLTRCIAEHDGAAERGV